MRIGLVTSGGDAPGMNASIRVVVRKGIFLGYEIFGIRRGYAGLLTEDFVPMDKKSVGGIIHHGGTILKSARCEEIKTDSGILAAAKILTKHNFNYLIIIGGDGSIRAGYRIAQKSKVPIICIPATIDNDIYGTDETIGFDTALDTAVEAIDKIRDTATSFDRIFIVEVMGREHGFLALEVALASGAELVLIPEKKYDLKRISTELKKQRLKGKTSVIIVFAEGTGDVYEVAKELQYLTNVPVRVSSLGYIQRGGSPSGRSRILGTVFGSYAIDLIRSGARNRVVVIHKCKITDLPVYSVVSREKQIDLSLCEILYQSAGMSL